ncbi:hypothetical protein EDB86DRAFT_3076206 [Lactarius hatsudake]|nr:hypothetical protein EDB86DRAFT_3076206 [Lactarius hatsudake]
MASDDNLTICDLFARLDVSLTFGCGDYGVGAGGTVNDGSVDILFFPIFPAYYVTCRARRSTHPRAFAGPVPCREDDERSPRSSRRHSSAASQPICSARAASAAPSSSVAGHLYECQVWRVLSKEQVVELVVRPTDTLELRLSAPDLRTTALALPPSWEMDGADIGPTLVSRCPPGHSVTLRQPMRNDQEENSSFNTHR